MSVGPTGTGARIALLNRSSRAQIEDVVRRVQKLETAVEPRFQEHFVGAMGLPHATDPFPRLAAGVPLPERRADDTPYRTGRVDLQQPTPCRDPAAGLIGRHAPGSSDVPDAN